MRLYYDNGRYSSSVEIEGIKIENNLVNLNVKINEGEASTIKEVKIIGNRSFLLVKLNLSLNLVLSIGLKYGLIKISTTILS